MSSQISPVCGNAGRSQSAPEESSCVGSTRRKAFKRPIGGDAKKVEAFYLHLASQLSSAPKRARTDGVLFGPTHSDRDISPLVLGPARKEPTPTTEVLRALSELDLKK